MITLDSRVAATPERSSAHGVLLGCAMLLRCFVLALSLSSLACGGSSAPASSVGKTEAPGDGPTRLERGAALDVAASDGAFMPALAVKEGERYLVLLVSASLSPGKTHDYRASLATSDEQGVSAVSAASGCTIDVLAPEPLQPPRGAPAPRAPGDLAVGTSRSFALRLPPALQTVTAEVRAVGGSAVVWADRTVEEGDAREPGGDEAPGGHGRGPKTVFDAKFVDEFLRDFEEIILPRGRAVFGHESDIDRDGRIALLFTPRTRKQGVAFFSGCDLSPSCPASNVGEVLYLTPPEAIAPPYNTPRAIKEILAHELEHLLHHHQRLQHSAEADRESAYLLEGFGALAQDVTGFQAGNLYVTKAGLDDVDVVSLGDVLAEGTEYDRKRDGPLRGISYLFVRWLYDRAGGDATEGARVVDRGGPTLVRRLLQAERSVAARVSALAASGELALDFYSALAFPAAGALNPCHAFLATTNDPITDRQRGADPFANFHGQKMTGARTQPLTKADGVLRAGGAEYLTFETDRATVVYPRVEVDGGAEAGVRVLRLE
jgi:hypothetical protein